MTPGLVSSVTIAAAAACGLDSIGIERDAEFFRMSEAAVPLFGALDDDGYERCDVERDTPGP